MKEYLHGHGEAILYPVKEILDHNTANGNCISFEDTRDLFVVSCMAPEQVFMAATLHTICNTSGVDIQVCSRIVKCFIWK